MKNKTFPVWVILLNTNAYELFIQLEVGLRKFLIFSIRNFGVYEWTKEIGRMLESIFITENGRKQEKLLGLITIEDITKEINY